MLPNEPTGQKPSTTESLQAAMEREIASFILSSNVAEFSLDTIYQACLVSPATLAYMGESKSPVKRYIVRTAISNALRHWIDNKTMNEEKERQNDL